MEITRDIYFKEPDKYQGRTVYVTAKEGVSDEVLDGFVKLIKEKPEEFLEEMYEGEEEAKKSSYNNKWYTVQRHSHHTFYILSKDAQS